jgi:hypothetical protein
MVPSGRSPEDKALAAVRAARKPNLGGRRGSRQLHQCPGPIRVPVPELARRWSFPTTPRQDDDLLFDLTVARSGETFRFRVDVDERAGEGMIVSIPDGGGRDPGIKATFALADMNGLTTTPQDEVGHTTFPGLGGVPRLPPPRRAAIGSVHVTAIGSPGDGEVPRGPAC